MHRYHVTYTRLDTGRGMIQTYKTLVGATKRAAQLHPATGVKVWDSKAEIGHRRVTIFGDWIDPTRSQEDPDHLREEDVFRGLSDEEEAQ